MTLIQSIVLGVVSGLTQFFPLSASGHIILVPWLFHWPAPTPGLKFALNAGASFALLLSFGKDFSYFLKGGLQSIIERKIGFDRYRSLFWLVGFGMLPSLVAGLAFHDTVHANLEAPLLIAIFLCAVGFFVYCVDDRYGAIKGMEEIKSKEAWCIGFGAAFGIIPGISRIAAAYIVGRLLGLGREATVRFTLLILFPIMLGETAYRWLELSALATGLAVPWSTLIGAVVASTLVGLFCIQTLLAMARSPGYSVFSIYRMAAGAFIVLWSLAFRM